MSKRVRGFTFLEAVVAVAILGMALLPVLSLMNQSLERIIRAADANEKSLVMSNALAYLEQVNPLKNPVGDVELGNARLLWTSEQVFATPHNGGALLTLGNYQITYHRVDVNVEDRQGEPWFSFDVMKTGYAKALDHNPFQP